MAALEENYSMKCRLAAIGLQPMSDWVSFDCQHSTIPGAMIVACASMFTEYLDAVPQEQDQLNGTPYSETNNLEDNLDNNGCVEYANELEPCFRRLQGLVKVPMVSTVELSMCALFAHEGQLFYSFANQQLAQTVGFNFLVNTRQHVLPLTQMYG